MPALLNKICSAPKVSSAAATIAEEFSNTICPGDVKGWEFMAGKHFSFDELVDIIVEREEQKKETARIVAKIRRDAIKNAQYLKTTTQKGFVAGFKKITDLNRAKAVEYAKANPEFKTMVADMTDAEIAAWFII